VLRYLLDTNVVSEWQKPRPHEPVLDFIRGNSVALALSWFTVAELRKGAAFNTRKDRQHELSRWTDELEREFAERILGIEAETARLWGNLMLGRTRDPIDTFLAATAVQHNLTLVTRNVRDFSDLPVKLVNPWET